METGAIGVVDLDEARLADDIEVILASEMSPIYSEYSRGNPGWRSAILFNYSGSGSDAYIKSYEPLGKFTDLGERLPYVKEIIESKFNVERLQWARVLGVQNGLIMPHRDYLDVSGGLIRVHLPIQTDATCMNSEESRVFHMAKGKIWYLNADRVHAAASLSDFNRLHICLDFKPADDIATVFRDPSEFSGVQVPENIERPPMSDSYMKQIYDLAYFFREENYFDVTSLLGRVHFLRDVDCRLAFDWLAEIARRSGSRRLIDRASDMKMRFLGERAAA